MLPIVRDRRRGVDQPGGLGRAVAQTLSGWWACCWVAIPGISESRANPGGATDTLSAKSGPVSLLSQYFSTR